MSKVEELLREQRAKVRRRLQEGDDLNAPAWIALVASEAGAVAESWIMEDGNLIIRLVSLAALCLEWAEFEAQI